MSTPSPNKLILYLSFAGTIPFILGTFLLLINVRSLPYLGSITEIIASYGLAIATFMAGSHWGIHLHVNDNWKIKLPLVSNAITLQVWFIYLLGTPRIIMSGLTVCFFILLMVDKRLKVEHILSEDYYLVRCWVSKIVIASLCIAAMVTI